MVQERVGGMEVLECSCYIGMSDARERLLPAARSFRDCILDTYGGSPIRRIRHWVRQSLLLPLEIGQYIYGHQDDIPTRGTLCNVDRATRHQRLL